MIIAFGHRRRVGKDTATAILSDMLLARGIPVKHVSFANSLKEVCSDLFGWAGLHGPAHYEEYPEEKEVTLPAIGLSPRDVWVEVGNKLRDVYEDIWIDLALNQPNLSKAVIIISDLRYPNEIDKVREAGGSVIKITRDAAPVGDDPADTALADFDNWDTIIENNGTAAEFRAKLAPLATVLETLYGFPKTKEQLEEGES
tara:strand:- start:755 stop:1354 length:600 start_codon:yes stop_codon:yes gene_type:complete